MVKPVSVSSILAAAKPIDPRSAYRRLPSASTAFRKGVCLCDTVQRLLHRLGIEYVRIVYIISSHFMSPLQLLRRCDGKIERTVRHKRIREYKSIYRFSGLQWSFVPTYSPLNAGGIDEKSPTLARFSVLLSPASLELFSGIFCFCRSQTSSPIP